MIKNKQLHERSSSVSVPSIAFINYSKFSNNYNHNINCNNRENYIFNKNVNNISNNNISIDNNKFLNSTFLKSHIKRKDNDIQANSSIEERIGFNTNLRNSLGTLHKKTNSYNNFNDKLIQINNSNSKKNSLFMTKLIDKSIEKKSSPLLQESSTLLKFQNGQLPKINKIENNNKYKFIDSSNTLLKFYKQNSLYNNNFKE